jgi:hypothetical protein
MIYYVEKTKWSRFDPIVCSDFWDSSQSNILKKTVHLAKELFNRMANVFIAAANAIYSLHHIKITSKFISIDENKLAALDSKEKALIDKHLVCFTGRLDEIVAHLA